MGARKISQVRNSQTGDAASAAPLFDTSKEALHLCLESIKDAKNETELRRLTEELPRIVFQRQYENAEN